MVSFNQVRKIFLWLLLLWVFYFAISEFVTNSVLQLQQISIAFTGFYWLIDIGFVFTGILVVVKYTNPIVEVIGILFTIFSGYLLSRFLENDLWAIAPPVYILHWGWGIVLLVNLIFFFKDLFSQKHFLTSLAQIHKKRLFQNLCILLILCGTTFSWSIYGFSQQITIHDSGTDNGIRISWYNLPLYGEFEAYNSTDGRQLLEKYQTLNSTFYLGFTLGTFTDVDGLSNLTAILHLFETYGINFVADIVPCDSNTPSICDFVTYNPTIVEIMNNTMDQVFHYVIQENFTNFRGISFDIEGPQNLDTPISPTLYQQALISYQNKLNEFQANVSIPGERMTEEEGSPGMMFDTIFHTHDEDLAQKTVTTGLNLTYYGFMLYMLGSGYSDYPFWFYCNLGHSQYGSHMIPWTGCADPNSYFDENPSEYARTLNEIKIAKSYGFAETVFCVSRNFISQTNYTESLQRLNDLIAIKNHFNDFQIPITQDLSIIQNPLDYWHHFTPYNLMANQDLFREVIYEMNGGWMLLIQVITLLFVSGFWLQNQNKRENPRKVNINSD